MARSRAPYDEIMIVNPTCTRGARAMKLYPIHPSAAASRVGDPPPGFTEGVGYVAEPYPYGEIAYVAEDEEVDGMAYVADPYDDVGYVADPYDDDVAYVADEPEVAGWVGDEEDVACVGDDEMGYGDEDVAWVADDEEEMAYAGEDELAAYLPEDREPPFSPRVVPTRNLAGVEGYVRPKTVNPTAEKIRPAESVPTPASGWFRPLW